MRASLGVDGANLMSMDLSVWSMTRFDLPAQLPRSDQWERYGAEWSFDGSGWQVVVLVADDNPDSAVTDRLPAASTVAYVSLEPIGADRTGYEFLERVVRELARSSGGVWVDPNGSVFAPDEGTFGLDV
jgi:hypothetical protein